MKLEVFEAMVARAQYRRKKAYGKSGASERRIYVGGSGGPRINIEVRHGAVSDFEAAVIEALLDEEGLFQDDEGDQDEPQGESG